MSELNEKQLRADIDQLRSQFPQTQDLYREVCVLLFFRYGITPTTNKLYQMVRKGSMSAPAEALNRFWEDLRDKSRVRIEHPDLPESLKTTAGDLVASLWSAAQVAAQEGLVVMRSEAQARVTEAKHAQLSAETDRDAARESHTLANQRLDQAHNRIDELKQTVAARDATIVALESQLQNARGENSALLQKLEDARRDFGEELRSARAALTLAEERFRSSEARALMEIDRERVIAAKVQKELAAVRVANDQLSERSRKEVVALNEQLGNLRQRAGDLEGSLRAVTANRDQVAEDLKTTQGTLENKQITLARIESEAREVRTKLEVAERRVSELLASKKPVRALRRKTAHSET